MNKAQFVSLLVVWALVICSASHATSVVVLANKTQIGVAADHKVLRANGSRLPDTCKIMRHGNFFFSFSGTVSNGNMESTKFNLMDVLVQASNGLKDLDAIVQKFDEAALGPMQEQLNYDFAYHRDSFRRQIKSVQSTYLEMIIFRVTPGGSEMVQSVFPATFGKMAKVEKPYHRVCKAGQGECQLTVGEQDRMIDYLQEHPYTTDLAADAERLVEFEARLNPKNVGGKITVLLIDSTGVHTADTSDRCPIEWRNKRPSQ